jgi:N-acetyl-gamma-glutamyl-phosphate reductase common form
MVSVGIVGGSGYMGGEALRVLLRHPQAEVAWVTSRSPGPIEQVHPNLYDTGLHFVHLEEVKTPDFVMLALPTGASMAVAARFLKAGARVIDLGAAFCLQDRDMWERVYGQEHTTWSLVNEAVYGIPELHAERIRTTRLVANPGCFASAAIFGLAPLLNAGLVEAHRLVVDGLSGTAGAGAGFSRAMHHPEIGGNVVLYNVVGHRHTYEMEQELTSVANRRVRVHFTPCYVPIVRGIVDSCRCFPAEAVSRAQLLDMFRQFYKGQPFVKVYDQPRDAGVWQYKPYPWVSSVAGTNYCYVGMDVDEERHSIVVMAVLDSVGKGGAQVGIENLNIMAGFARSDGLLDRGLYPWGCRSCFRQVPADRHSREHTRPSDIIL